jgi:glycosyltransferase involved in cell wall biosynthesis
MIEEAIHLLEGNNMQAKLSRCPRILRKKLRIPINAFIGKIDIFHAPFDNLLPVYGCKKIVTIHDLRYFDIYPQLHKVLPELSEDTVFNAHYKDWDNWIQEMRKRVSSAVKNADSIITNSRHTRHSLINLFHINPEKVHTVYLGCSPRFRQCEEKVKIQQITEKLGIDERYFLYVGQMDPFKNILRLIDAFYRIKHESVVASYKLVFITPTPKDCWFHQIVSQKIKRLSLEKDIISIHNLPDIDLPYVYGGAEALLLPSLYEGFGLPPLEAMACGIPAVVSDVGALPEVVGDSALLVNPYSTTSIAEGIHRIVSDRKLQEELTQLGLERAKRFSWEKAARETIEVYKEAANR